MKSYLKRSLICLGAVLVLMLVANAAGKPSEADTACNFLGQALTDLQQIKAGTSRSGVERYFERDGGVQFATTTRYVYKKCGYLHVDVEFDRKSGSGQRSPSLDDTVAFVSKLYVDYPAKD